MVMPGTEVELKFQVPAHRREAVEAWLRSLPGGAAPRQRLRAVYVDTPDRALASAGLALRLRSEGRRWVQTLKGLAGDGLTRLEHEQVLRASEIDRLRPWPDPARHAGHPLGERLLARLAGAQGALDGGFRTDILRRRARLRGRHGEVELAFDRGEISAAGRRLPVCELEIELCSGHPRAVIDAARRWALPLGLWLDTRSKAQRGDLLARGRLAAPPVALARPRPARGAGPAEALQGLAARCRAAVLDNASQIADGEFEPAHLVPLRQALRRLARGPLEPAESGALADAARSLHERLSLQDGRAAATMLMREPPAQRLLLDLLALSLV